MEIKHMAGKKGQKKAASKADGAGHRGLYYDPKLETLSREKLTQSEDTESIEGMI